MAESTLIVLLIILFFGLVTPELFRRLRLPYVTSLIIIGAILGPNGLGYIASNETVEFFGFLGLTFLMLMAGLETDTEKLNHSKRSLAMLVLCNGLLPFLAGFAITWLFGHGLWPALVVGVVFVSSSVAIAVPAIKAYEFSREGEGAVMVAAIVINDVVSLALLAIVLQSFSPVTDLPLPQYFAALIISVLFFQRVVPRLARRFFSSRLAGQTRYENQLRFVIVLTIAILVFFSFLGVHPIIAAFLVGLLLSKVVTTTEITDKLHTLGYGLFVPVFFFIIGMELDFGLLVRSENADLYVILLITGFLIVKYFGGYLGGRLAGLKSKTSSFFGIASLPQLTTTLAAVYAAESVGIINTTIVTGVTLLSVLTTFLSPWLLRVNAKRLGAKPAEGGPAAQG